MFRVTRMRLKGERNLADRSIYSLLKSCDQTEHYSACLYAAFCRLQHPPSHSERQTSCASSSSLLSTMTTSFCLRCHPCDSWLSTQSRSPLSTSQHTAALNHNQPNASHMILTRTKRVSVLRACVRRAGRAWWLAGLCSGTFEEVSMVLRRPCKLI